MELSNVRWFHGSDHAIEQLNVHGSGMNLWGRQGAYLSDHPPSARLFGPVLSEFTLVPSARVLNTDTEIPFAEADAALTQAQVPPMIRYQAEWHSYGEVIALMAEYQGGERSPAVAYFQAQLGLDALYTPDVDGRLDGERIHEGNLLIVLNPACVQFVRSYTPKATPDDTPTP